MYSYGDRVRCSVTANDGLPLVRYGFVRSMTHDSGPVVVMFDGEIGGEVIELDQIEPVSITSVELRLDGSDLLDDPDLRRGLTSLWKAEAESAGLDVDGINSHGLGEREPGGVWSLASLTSGGERYVLRASHLADDPAVVVVRTELFGSVHQMG